ncbi:hypothetical protein YC2023_023119 [Brassica napus]
MQLGVGLHKVGSIVGCQIVYLEGGILHPLIFFLGNNHLVQGNDLKKKKTKKSKALTFDNTAERNDHNSESDGDKHNLHRLLNC